MRGFTPISSKTATTTNNSSRGGTSSSSDSKYRNNNIYIEEEKKIYINNVTLNKMNSPTLNRDMKGFGGLKDFFDIPKDTLKEHDSSLFEYENFHDDVPILQSKNDQQHQQEQNKSVHDLAQNNVVQIYGQQELLRNQLNFGQNGTGIPINTNNQDNNVPPAFKENKHPVEKNIEQKQVSNKEQRKKDVTETKQQEKKMIPLSCVYTKHKTQKRKVWSDGTLKLDAINGYMALYAGDDGTILLDNLLETRNVFPNDVKRVIASYEAGRSEIIEFEKYLVSVEPATVPVISVPKIAPKPYQIPKFKPPSVKIPPKQSDDRNNVFEQPKSKTITRGLYSVDEDDIEDSFHDEYTIKDKNDIQKNQDSKQNKNDFHINTTKSLGNNIWDDDDYDDSTNNTTNNLNTHSYNPKRMKYDDSNGDYDTWDKTDKWNNKADGNDNNDCNVNNERNENNNQNFTSVSIWDWNF